MRKVYIVNMQGSIMGAFGNIKEVYNYLAAEHWEQVANAKLWSNSRGLSNLDAVQLNYNNLAELFKSDRVLWVKSPKLGISTATIELHYLNEHVVK